jgi:hypothetical protein
MAPIVEARATAQRAMGAASEMDSPKKKTKRGTDKIPPPAPVRPISTPTSMPSEGLMRVE